MSTRPSNPTQTPVSTPSIPPTPSIPSISSIASIPSIESPNTDTHPNPGPFAAPDPATFPADSYYYLVAMIEFRLNELLDTRLQNPAPDNPLTLKELDAAMRILKSGLDARQKIARLEKPPRSSRAQNSEPLPASPRPTPQTPDIADGALQIQKMIREFLTPSTPDPDSSPTSTPTPASSPAHTSKLDPQPQSPSAPSVSSVGSVPLCEKSPAFPPPAPLQLQPLDLNPNLGPIRDRDEQPRPGRTHPPSYKTQTPEYQSALQKLRAARAQNRADIQTRPTGSPHRAATAPQQAA